MTIGSMLSADIDEYHPLYRMSKHDFIDTFKRERGDTLWKVQKVLERLKGTFPLNDLKKRLDVRIHLVKDYLISFSLEEGLAAMNSGVTEPLLLEDSSVLNFSGPPLEQILAAMNCSIAEPLSLDSSVLNVNKASKKAAAQKERRKDPEYKARQAEYRAKRKAQCDNKRRSEEQTKMATLAQLGGAEKRRTAKKISK
jgi:hypothetical protein